MARLLTVALILIFIAAAAAPLNSAPSAAARAMSEAATALLGDLNPEQKSKATFKFEDDSRFEYRFTPRARTGLPMKEMTEPQRARVQALLKSGLSMRGYTAATAIMDLENVLRAIEPPRTGPNAIVRDPEMYFVSIYGTPGGKAPWGWKFEGHHISVNFTLVDDKPVVFTPSFFGSNPAVVRDGPKAGTRVLRDEEEAGRALLAAFDEAQRAKVIFDVTAPRDMITGENREAEPLDPADAAVAAPLARKSNGRVSRTCITGACQGASRAGAEGGDGHDHVRLGRHHRGRWSALLPRAGADIPDRIRQHAEQRQPHPLRVARFQRRLRPRPAARSLQDSRARIGRRRFALPVTGGHIL
jgi:hypothetical protein